MHKVDIARLIKYSTTGPEKTIFYEEGDIKAQIVCLKAGQLIPPCKMGNDVLFYIIQGEGEIVVDGEREPLQANISIVVPKIAQSRSISAKTDMVILAVQGTPN